MSTVVFEKAIVTYTFLVDAEALDISSHADEMKRRFEEAQSQDFPVEN